MARYNTMRRFDRRDNKYVDETIVHMDCSHNLIYVGQPDILEEMVKLNRGSIDTYGLTRCAECTLRVAGAL